MKTSGELFDIFNGYLKELSLDRKPRALYEPIRYVLSLGGKRIRPMLMLLGYQLYKDTPEHVLSQACGLEMYHNYTLLHDDLMDNADVRRGQPTVHKRWNDNVAILSGDSMLVLAFQLMSACDDGHLREVMDLFVETALQIGEGQQYDMDFENRTDVTEAEYIEMIRLKTSVLLACALKTGALLADAPARDAGNLYRYGEQIGLAFQLQDDFLDVYGDPGIFGKAIGGDIASNKKTYMLINAFNHASDDQQRKLLRWITARDFDKREKIEAVTRLYNEIGVDRMAKERISYYFEQSKQYLQAVNLPGERKKELVAFVGQMIHRQY